MAAFVQISVRWPQVIEHQNADLHLGDRVQLGAEWHPKRGAVGTCFTSDASIECRQFGLGSRSGRAPQWQLLITEHGCSTFSDLER